MRSWRALLDGDTRERALQAAFAVADQLAATPWEELSAEATAGATAHVRAQQSANLTAGRSGAALLLCYKAQFTRADDDAAQARQLLQQAVDTLESTEMGPALFTGFTGLAWVATHLDGRVLDKGESDEFCQTIDDALWEIVTASPWRDEFDLISGLVGFGNYFLRRLPRDRAAQALEQITLRLDESAERAGEGRAWSSTSDGATVRLFDLGMAHGAAGVIALLGRLCSAGIGGPLAPRLLDEAVRWLLHCARPAEPVCFPGRVDSRGHIDQPRHGWCYGDPGIAAALWGAGRRAARPEWQETALTVAARAAKLRPDETTIFDAGLCHGGAGVAHLFNRLGQASGDATCLQAARDWFGWTLARRRVGEGIGGFLVWDSESARARSIPGFLVGAAGTALALLAASGEVAPDWDEALLISP
jgi:lantibiotic modifying enzyme